ncbi:DUF1149 family protein [Enterococcus camelliae]|uniref:DUF1149 family protein n=1 Tax=Enterococcus camelliae TaxID=453959 RepID=A0ABW5TIK6_9ENTE
MDIRRQKPIVESYHYDMKKPEEEVETKLNVGFMPLTPPDAEYPKENSIIGARLEFTIAFPEFVLTGAVGQINHIVNQTILKAEDISREEADLLVAPLFDIVKRLTYEVTEIITDEPGIDLNFNSQDTE